MVLTPRLLLTFSFAGLCGCNAAETNFDRLYAPERNPNPSHQIELSGLNEAGFEILMSVTFVTANDRCKRTTNVEMGASSPRVATVPLEVQRTGTSYRAFGPVDALKPGYCDWKPFSVNYEIRRGPAKQLGPVPPSPIVWFTSNGRSSLPEAEIACALTDHRGESAYVCSVPLGRERNTVLGSHKLKVHFVEREWRQSVKP